MRRASLSAMSMSITLCCALRPALRPPLRTRTVPARGTLVRAMSAMVSEPPPERHLHLTEFWRERLAEMTVADKISEFRAAMDRDGTPDTDHRDFSPPVH